ncbi:hypothetical protein P7K49_015220, partial [Saguinus oedipus]
FDAVRQNPALKQAPLTGCPPCDAARQTGPSRLAGITGSVPLLDAGLSQSPASGGTQRATQRTPSGRGQGKLQGT